MAGVLHPTRRRSLTALSNVSALNLRAVLQRTTTPCAPS